MQEKILRATAKIISNHGIKNTSTRAICDEVGITAPTLYYYFKDKTELVDAVTQFAFEIHRQNKKKARTENSFSNLKLFWDEYMRFAMSEPELHRTMLVSISQGRMVKNGPACFVDLLAEFKTLEKSELLKHSAIQSAQMFLAAAQGLSILLLALPKTKTLHPLSESTRDIMLQGLVNKTL
jgi:AcrR family transcriptional regulator